MKKNNNQAGTVTGPLLKDLMATHKAERQAVMPSPEVKQTEESKPDLYQDSGGGYNSNFTFPQD
jgi:hypothetical protein